MQHTARTAQSSRRHTGCMLRGRSPWHTPHESRWRHPHTHPQSGSGRSDCRRRRRRQVARSRHDVSLRHADVRRRRRRAVTAARTRLALNRVNSSDDRELIAAAATVLRSCLSPVASGASHTGVGAWQSRAAWHDCRTGTSVRRVRSARALGANGAGLFNRGDY
jgi:hypothetical protein